MITSIVAIKSHGSIAGFPGSYESGEPVNPRSMQFSNLYDNKSAVTLMHKGPAGKVLDNEGGFPNVMAIANKSVQVLHFYHFTFYFENGVFIFEL